MTNERVLEIVGGMSELIFQAALECGNEQYIPSHANPDNLDDYIKTRKQRVAVLRRLREEFENEMTGVLL